MREYRRETGATRLPDRTKSDARAIASAASDNSPTAVFGEIGLLLATTFGLVTLVQIALVVFHHVP